MKYPPKPHVAIIGAGLAGLSAAAYLSARGCRITLLEQQPFPGGKVGEFRDQGFRFDTGPSLCTMPEVFDNLFNALGSSLSQESDWIPLKPGTRNFFPSGIRIDATSDIQAFQKEIASLSTKDAEMLPKFLAYSSRLFKKTSPWFLERPFRETIKDNWTDLPTAFTSIPLAEMFRTMHSSLRGYFKSPEVIQLFARSATYNGSSPYKTPAVFNVIPHVEFNQGAFFPKEGIASLISSITRLLSQREVVMEHNTAVKRILHRSNVCSAIQLANGDELGCDAIISTIDSQITYRKLLRIPSKVGNQRSLSAMVFLWGVGTEHKELLHHNIFFSQNYKKEFHQLFRENCLPDDPTVYVCISSKTKHDDAPQGGENWFVLVNAPSTLKDYSVDVLRDRIFKKLELFGIDQPPILTESTLTPRTIAIRDGSSDGALYGNASHSLVSAFLRHPNSNQRFSNLFHAGGTVHPGGGMPLAILSGKHSASLCLKTLAERGFLLEEDSANNDTSNLAQAA